MSLMLTPEEFKLYLDKYNNDPAYKEKINKRSSILSGISTIDDSRTIRDVIVQAALVVETHINDIFRITFKEGEILTSFKKSGLYLSDKLKIIEAIDYVVPREVLNALRALNSLRNDFAHNLNYVVTWDNAKKLTIVNPAKVEIHFNEKPLNYISGTLTILIEKLIESRDRLKNIRQELDKKEV